MNLNNRVFFYLRSAVARPIAHGQPLLSRLRRHRTDGSVTKALHARASSRVSLIASIFILSFVLNACATAPALEPLPAAVESTPYLLQPGDEISIRFYLTPELDEDIRIPPDGILSLRLVGPVRATGKTTEELSEELQSEYKRELKSPDIAVVLRKTQSSQVFVGGEVTRPQAVAFSPNMTPVEAILNAGGFKRSAKLQHVLIIRKDATGKPVPYEVDLERMLNGETAIVPVQPLDIVYVPKTRIAKVNQFVDSYVRQLLFFNGFNYQLNDDE